MSLWISAPWDLIQTTIMLPSPRLGNTKALAVGVNIRNAINGDLYSYVKTNPRKTLSWDFYLTRSKALELQLFIETYNDIPWRITTWDEEVYRAVLLSDPSFEQVAVENRTQVSLEFEGIRIDG